MSVILAMRQPISFINLLLSGRLTDFSMVECMFGSQFRMAWVRLDFLYHVSLVFFEANF